MIAFDFFCGAGGLTRGLSDSNITVIAGFDNDEKCKETFEYNNPNTKFVLKDIRDVGVVELKKLANLNSFENVLFAGCAPCQPFSPHRKDKLKTRMTTLLSEFGRLVKETKPGWILIENVPGITRVNGFSTFKRFIKLLEAMGYNYHYDILNAKKFGVPQNRKRLVLIASFSPNSSLPKPLFDSAKNPFRTVRQTISHFPKIRAGECDPRISNHVAASLSELNMNRIRSTPKNGGDRRVWPEYLTLNCHSNETARYTDIYGRMYWDEPAPTITGRCNSLSNGRYGHPEQDRAISLREAASLQTFPDDYVFFGPNWHIAKQIGNAVPVLLAKELGNHILKLDMHDS